MSERLDPFLLDLLVCPEDKQSLWYLDEEACLYNPRLRRRYRIQDGIPVLLVEEGEAVGDEEHARLKALHRSGKVVETGHPQR